MLKYILTYIECSVVLSKSVYVETASKTYKRIVKNA